MRIGTIGCGDWGRNHARVLAELGVLAAVADEDAAKRAAAEAAFGCRSTDLDGLIADPGIDGVVLALPPTLHPEVALRVIGAGKHLLVEKPMAMTALRAEEIVKAAEAAGVVAMTGHILRFHPGYEALETAVRDGELGAIRYVHSTRLGLGKFFAQTDVMWDIAPHDLSLLLAIVGEAPETGHLEGVSGITDVPDFAHLHLRFPSGAKSHTFVSRLSPRRERRFTVIGDKAMAVLDDIEPPETKLAIYRHKVWKENGGVKFESADPEFRPIGDAQPLTSELQHFLQAIRTGAVPRSSVREGMEVIKALELSASGAAVAA
ncbi:MAG: Gfo/Idh/MocA family oxidoreductase [Paracoccaceae bacterium]|nr:Gfo/Idh/MocA family oxidoreductase [Paracoccaceae bacterium]